MRCDLLLNLSGPAVVLALALGQQPAQSNSKIDPRLEAQLRAGRPVQVIVLGTTQLFEPVGGLEAFAQQHATDHRLELRRRVIDELKLNAEKEQARIRAALGQARPLRSLWIVNAVALRLSPEQVRKASRLPEVRYIYPANEPFRPEEPPGKVSLQITPERQHFTLDGKRIPWNVERIGAARVWRELGILGEGVTVAVLDAGVNYAHTDLRNNLWVNSRETPGNGKDDDDNGYIDDQYGYDFARMQPDVRDVSEPRQHGTFTSGIIAGDGSGGILTGIAPRARIMPLRGQRPTAAALAYQYALENGADIMSMSFSIPDLGNLRGLWRMMSDHAVAAGLVLVGGAGNDQQSVALPYQHQSPKDVPSVISVGGVDSLMHLVRFSSLGPAEWGTVALYRDYPMPNGLIKPDLVAFPGPGYPVLAAADAGYIDPNLNIRGNSFSGPHAAGVAALMLSAAPATPAWRIKQIMEATARDLGTPGKDNQTGAGFIDAFAAVQALK